jgi:hypothetical protein
MPPAAVHLTRLREEIAQGHALAIVGAGISIGATRNAKAASWTGLLEHGVDHCQSLGQPADWAGRVRAEICSGDMDDLLSAAEKFKSHRRVGSILGEANCIQSLGDIALNRSDQKTANGLFGEALILYSRIQEPFSIGWTRVHLARLAERPEERQTHIDAAREAWTRIKRLDLVARLDQEFGPAEPDVEN